MTSEHNQILENHSRGKATVKNHGQAERDDRGDAHDVAKVDQFWIANALYLAFVLAAIASAVVKIIAYRRGF